jgi:quercetin dioxygenase-like cupin family protein
VVKSGGAAWAALAPRDYKGSEAEGSYCEVTRRLLLGGEEGDELAFELRYFEVAAGGWTSLERHRHPHAVVVLCGRGEVQLRAERHALEPFDAVYVAPGDPHQFRAAADQKLGLLCVVDRERDRPELLGEPEAGAPSARRRRSAREP